MTTDVNLLAVLVGALINMVLGAAWYGIFATPWMKHAGFSGKSKDAMQGGGIGYAVAMVASVVISYVMAVVMPGLGGETFLEGVGVGAVLWAGFVATTYAATYIFSKKSFTLYAIDAGYSLVGFALIGGLVASWQ